MYFWHCMITPVVPICYCIYELGTVCVCISLDIVFFIITFLFGLYVYVHAVRLSLLLL